MQKQTDYSFHLFIRGIIFIGIGLLFIQFIKRGTVEFFPAAWVPFIYFATIVFIVLGIIHVWKSGEKKRGIPIARGKMVIIYASFMMTIVAGFLFSSTAAQVKIPNEKVENQEDFIKELEQMYGIEEDLPSDLHLEE